MPSDEFFSSLYAGSAATGAASSAGAAAGTSATTTAATTTTASNAAQIASYASTALSVLSAVSEKTTADYNAGIARKQAAEAAAAAAAEESRQRRIDEMQQARFLAVAGTQGTMFEGSPMLAYLENAKQAELNAQDIRYSGALKSRGLKSEASLYKARGAAGLLGGLAKSGASLASTLLRIP